MGKDKEFNKLGVSQRMKMSEKLGAKVAIIMNKAREKCNKLLQPTGYGVNIKVDFYRLEQGIQDEIKPEAGSSG